MSNSGGVKTPVVGEPTVDPMLEEIQKLNQQLEHFNNFVAVLPELLVLHALVSYRGLNQTPVDAVKTVRAYTQAFFEGLAG